MRDDFPQRIKDILARRVGFICSNPNCRKSTSGPQEDPYKAINIGVASHITAAAPGGLRYDSSITAEQRASIDNGIWLCQSCSKLIDSDEVRYTVDVLRTWKNKAENEALLGIQGKYDSSLLPSNKLQNLIENRKIVEAGELFGRMVSSRHPLFPHYTYGIAFDGSKATITHVPTNAEVVAKYPIHYKIHFDIPEVPFKVSSFKELIDHCYKKQRNLEINVHSLETWIGDELMETEEARQDKPIRGFISPPKFPDPKPMKLYFSDNSWSIDYLEMGVVKIEDDGALIINNSKQKNSKMFVQTTIDMVKRECNFSVEIDPQYSNNVQANYLLNYFAYYSNQNKQLVLKLLEEDRYLLKSNISVNNYTPQKSFQSYLKFLGDLITLEEYYQVQFELPETNPNKEELRIVQLLLFAARGEALKGPVNDVSFTTNRIGLNQVLSTESITTGTLFKQEELNGTISIFGTHISFKEHQIIMKLKIIDKEKLVQKLEHMDEEDTVKVTLMPCGDKQYIETLKF